MATLDQVSSVFTAVQHQATFSRCIRDDVVLSILTEIRQMYPHDILVNSIKDFAPELLGKIVDVAFGKICGMFQAQSAKVPVHLTPTVGSPVQDNISPDVTEQQPTARPNTYCGGASPAPPTPTAEPDSVTKVQAKENVNEKLNLDKDPKPAREPDSVPVFPAPLTPPVQPVVFTEAQEGLNRNETEPTPHPQRDSGVVSPPPTPCTLPAERCHGTDIQNKEVTDADACLEDGSAVIVNSPTPLNPPLEPAFTVIDSSEIQVTKEKRAMGFFHCLCRPLSCGCANSHTDTG